MNSPGNCSFPPALSSSRKIGRCSSDGSRPAIVARPSLMNSNAAERYRGLENGLRRLSNRWEKTGCSFLHVDDGGCRARRFVRVRIDLLTAQRMTLRAALEAAEKAATSIAAAFRERAL